jgi:rhodanese-related sulfurtransferase
VSFRPWRQALAIVLLAVLPALASAFFHPKRPAWSRETLAKDEVTVAMAQGMEGVVWVDARPAKAFAVEHIPGAFSLNEDGWNHLLLPFAMQFQPEQTIVVYCDSLECNASHQVAARLRKELGAQKVFVLKGGWESWKAAK